MFRLPASLGGAPLPEVEIIEADTESFDVKYNALSWPG